MVRMRVASKMRLCPDDSNHRNGPLRQDSQPKDRDTLLPAMGVISRNLVSLVRFDAASHVDDRYG